MYLTVSQNTANCVTPVTQSVFFTNRHLALYILLLVTCEGVRRLKVNEGRQTEVK